MSDEQDDPAIVDLEGAGASEAWPPEEAGPAAPPFSGEGGGPPEEDDPLEQGHSLDDGDSFADGDSSPGAAAGDPFAAWPQPESQMLVEDAPAEGEDAVQGQGVEPGVGVAHVDGEIDVPDGYTVLAGTPTGHRRSVALIVSRFNGGLTSRMLARAIEALEEAGVAAAAVTVVPVPGAFELPLAAMALAKTRRYACVVALGAIVRGETPHFDYIASEAASGLQLAGIETGVPVAFGVLTVETIEQAEARIDRAAVAVRTALEMADLFARLRASAQAG